MTSQHPQTSVSSSSDSAHDSYPEGLFSASRFDRQLEFTEFVLDLLEQWHQSTSSGTRYTFTEVPLLWGEAVYAAVEKKWRLRLTWDAGTQIFLVKLPNFAHDCVHIWIQECRILWSHFPLSLAKVSLFYCGSGTTINLQHSLKSQSKKQPDAFLKLNIPGVYPSIAFEVGWSESEEELAAAAKLLLRGSGGLTRMVVTVKWTASLQTRTVAGALQVWRLSQWEQPFVSYSQTIFPAPSPPQPQYLEFTLADIFLSTVPQGQSPTDILRCDINLLRRYAAKAFQEMNFRPALATAREVM